MANYKSGVLMTDHPDEDSTVIYKKQQEIMREKTRILENRHRKRLSGIERYQNTNPSINFNNVNYSIEGVQEFPKQIFQIVPHWKSKGTSPEKVIKNLVTSSRQTQDRIFGHNLDQQVKSILSERAKYLRYQETRGKDFNIVSNTYSEKYPVITQTTISISN